MLCFDHVSFAYPGERTILNDLSFSVSEGEQVGLIGANGAGKSTLMKAALGLITVSGTITIDGLEMNRDNLADIRRRLGYVLQDSDNQMFMPTVFEDMLFGPLNYGMPRPEAEALVDQTLAKLNLTHLKNRRNHKLSGGEKRMAAIATILAMQPKIMLMDEPSTALDPKKPPHAHPHAQCAAGDEDHRNARSRPRARDVRPCSAAARRADRGRRSGMGDPARPGAA